MIKKMHNVCQTANGQLPWSTTHNHNGKLMKTMNEKILTKTNYRAQ